MKRLLPFLCKCIIPGVILSGCAPSGGCGLQGEPPCQSKDYYLPGKGVWADRSESPGEKFLRELFFPKSKRLTTSTTNLDKIDQKYATKTLRETLKNNRDGQLSTWKSPNKETVYGSSAPVATNGNCREFVSRVQVGNDPRQIRGTACMENNEWVLKRLYQ